MLQMLALSFFVNLVFDKTIKPGDLMTGSMPAEESAKWFGVAPPDLTLVSRYKGDDWIYSYLRAYYEDASKQYGSRASPFDQSESKIWSTLEATKITLKCAVFLTQSEGKDKKYIITYSIGKREEVGLC